MNYERIFSIYLVVFTAVHVFRCIAYNFPFQDVVDLKQQAYPVSLTTSEGMAVCSKVCFFSWRGGGGGDFQQL